MRWRTDWRSSRWLLGTAATASWPVPRNDEVSSAPLPASSVGCGWPCRRFVDTRDCRTSSPLVGCMNTPPAPIVTGRTPILPWWLIVSRHWWARQTDRKVTRYCLGPRAASSPGWQQVGLQMSRCRPLRPPSPIGYRSSKTTPPPQRRSWTSWSPMPMPGTRLCDRPNEAAAATCQVSTDLPIRARHTRHHGDR